MKEKHFHTFYLSSIPSQLAICMGCSMNILIVDDERLVRITLQSIIEELYGSEHYIFQAGGAGEMYTMLQKMPFDLVFLDINMPKTQGLEAMEHVKERYKETDWCILTGYGYFEYAKKALELGAKGYLLKPLDPDELRKFMDSIKEEQIKRQKANHSLFAEAIRKSIFLDDFTDVQNGEGQFCLYVFFIDTREEGKRRELYNHLYQELEKYMISYSDAPDDEFGIFFWTTGELCMLVRGKAQIRINSFLKLHFGGHGNEAIIVGFSSEFKGIQELNPTLHFMMALAPLRFYKENLVMTKMDEFHADADIMEKQYLCEQMEELISEYLVDDLEGFNHVAQKINSKERWKTEDSIILTEEVIRHLNILWGADFKARKLDVLLQEMKSFFTKKQFMHNSRSDIILKFRKYVEENYMEDISIEKMGEVFGITPTYLSRIFREKTGEKYIDYLTKVRMEKARNLLESKQYSVKQVSDMVGYASEKHFSKLFKKYYGISPSNYQK